MKEQIESMQFKEDVFKKTVKEIIQVNSKMALEMISVLTGM